jgi:hypothetical protein
MRSPHRARGPDVLADTYKSARNGIPGNAFTLLLQVAAAFCCAGTGCDERCRPRKWRGSAGSAVAAKEAILPRYEGKLPRDEETLGKYQAILPAREEILPRYEAKLPREEEILGKYQAILPAREEKLPRYEANFLARKRCLVNTKQ